MLKGVSRLILKAVVAIAALCASTFAQGGWTDDGSVVRLTTNSDIVGLGLWSPGYSFPSAGQVKLHVDGGQFTEGRVDWRLWVSNTPTIGNPSGAGVGIKFQHGNSTSWDSTKWAGVAGVAEAGNSNYIGLAFYTHTDGQTTQSTAERMRITGTGSVGINKTNPGEKLEVNGNVKCDTVKCAVVKINGWTLNAPDFVFEKNYKLPSLKDVEKHIAIKKHLPDVPSASEIKKNGINLAEMNMALLKKVEELTLYAIDQNKKLEEQQKQIDGLRGMIGK